MSNDVYIGLRVADLDISEPASVISKVVLTKDSETEYVAGNDSGRTLKVSHPWGSQAMADSILASVKDYVYKPYTAKDAILDPAAELGDFVTVGGVYSTIADMDTEMNSLFQVTIKAPKSDEIDDEYPYSSSPEKDIERKIKGAYSKIAKTNERIDLEVGLLNDELDKYSTIEMTNESIRLSVAESKSYTDAETGKINGELQKYSTIEMTNEKIQLSVTESKNYTNEKTSHSLKLDANGVYITDANGNTVTISGGQIDAKTIKAQDLVLTGVITFSDLDSSAQSTINSKITSGQATSIITDKLIASPTIAGGKFMNLGQTTWLEIGKDTLGNNNAYGLVLTSNNQPDGIFAVYNGDFGYTSFCGKDHFYFLTVDSGYETVWPSGEWNFRDATVTNLYLTFS